MAESQVSMDGITYSLPAPFMVIATQNPIEMLGTYRLPEAQLDRFFMRVSLGYPSPADEALMLESQMQSHPIHDLMPVLGQQEIVDLQDAVKHVHVSQAVRAYIADIAAATRNHPKLRIGASPRASLALVRAAQASVLKDGGDFVKPATVKRVVATVLAHRVMLHPHYATGPGADEAVVKEIVASVPPPVR
jgi:MoxR-like ATPase